MSVAQRLSSLFKRGQSSAEPSILSQVGLTADEAYALDQVKSPSEARPGNAEALMAEEAAAPLDTGSMVSLPLLGTREPATHRRILTTVLIVALVVFLAVMFFALAQADNVARQVGASGQSLMQSQMKQSAGKDLGRTATKRLLSNYPDYGKAPADYLVALADCLANLTEAELAFVMHPQTGIAARSKFLPSVAEIHELLKDEGAQHEQFKPAHTTYHRFKPEPEFTPELPERRKQVVIDALGYNPQDRKRKNDRTGIRHAARP